MKLNDERKVEPEFAEKWAHGCANLDEKFQ